jgi:hypothetical protein
MHGRRWGLIGLGGALLLLAPPASAHGGAGGGEGSGTPGGAAPRASAPPARTSELRRVVLWPGASRVHGAPAVVMARGAARAAAPLRAPVLPLDAAALLGATRPSSAPPLDTPAAWEDWPSWATGRLDARAGWRPRWW